MKTFLILCALMGVSYAGVVPLSGRDAEEKLQQFEELCESGQVPETGAQIDLDGVRTWVYCKRSGGRDTINAPPKQGTFTVKTPPQAVFVKPADLSLRQRVTVSGTVKGSKTKIYYVPPKVDSNIDVSVNSNTERPEKPTVFFLKGRNGSSSSSSSSRSNSRASAPSQDDDFDAEGASQDEGRLLTKESLLRELEKSGANTAGRFFVVRRDQQ